MHILCRNSHLTTELLQVLLDEYSEAAVVADPYGSLPLHTVCCNQSVSVALLQALLARCPEVRIHLHRTGAHDATHGRQRRVDWPGARDG